MRKEFGLYIHIPFCRQKCFYCDFPSFAGREKKIDRYLQALEQEFALLRPGLYQKDNVRDTERKFAPRTIYIGGGTGSTKHGKEQPVPTTGRDEAFLLIAID